MSVANFFLNYRAAVAAALLIGVAMAGQIWADHAIKQPMKAIPKLTIDDLGVETVDSPEGRMITEEGIRQLARGSEAERNMPFSVPHEQVVRDSWIDGFFAAAIFVVAIIVYFLIYLTSEPKTTLATAIGMLPLAYLTGLRLMPVLLVIAAAVLAFFFRRHRGT